MSETKWIRSAFWVGTPRAGAEDSLRKAIDEQLLPAFKRLPGVADARALWPSKREDDPPAIACQFLVEFASRDDLERMLACPERVALRPQVKEAVALFDGHVSHIEYEVA